jgi:hypothetical protein
LRADKTPWTDLISSLLAILLPFHSLSSLGDPQQHPTLALPLPSHCKLARGFAEAKEEGRRLPSRATPLTSLLSLSGFPDLLLA